MKDKRERTKTVAFALLSLFRKIGILTNNSFVASLSIERVPNNSIQDNNSV